MSEISPTWLFILPWDISYPGGVNQVVINLINTFQKTPAIKPKLFVDQADGTLNNIANISIDYLPLTNPCWSPGVLGLVKYLIKLPVLFFRLHHYISADVQCINPHYPTLNVINFVLYKILGFYNGKIILSFHGSDIVGIKKTAGLEKCIWNFIFCHVDFMVCCSQKLADELVDYISCPEINRKIKVIHNGIDEKVLDFAHSNSAALPDEIMSSRFILNVGTFQYIKGQDILIRAFAKLKDTNKSIKLVLIGRNSDALISCRQLALQLGCKNNVIFIENMEHEAVLSYFRRADLFCLPSRYESFGIVLLEAGFFSCPVIASNVGGIPEIIEDGYDGWLVEADNADELAYRLDELLNNSEKAKRMGKRLRKKVIKTFTWDVASLKYLKLLV